MASKKIKRTLIVSYDYDVMRRKGNVMELVGVVNHPSAIRSIKEQKQALIDNGFEGTDVLVLTGTTQKSYEMSEEDFKEYATVVTEVTEPENETEQTEQK